MQERLANLETGIRSIPLPPSDRVLERFRREGDLLNDLPLTDYNLILPCREVCDQAQTLTVDTWSAQSAYRRCASLRIVSSPLCALAPHSCRCSATAYDAASADTSTKARISAPPHKTSRGNGRCSQPRLPCRKARAA